MADVARAERAGHLGVDRRPEHPAEAAGDLVDGHAPPAPDVDRVPVGAVRLERERARAGDVADVDEVPALLAVLVDERPLAVPEPRGCGAFPLAERR